MARSRKVSRKKRSAKRKTSRKVAKRCPPGCVKKPMLLTDNGKIILGSTKAAKPKRKTSRKVSRKRRSVKRKVSRKKRSVKRKVSRKRRSVKRKASRKVSRKRRSVKRKSRKRKSAKRKASRKRRSAKRKASRKRKSAKRKASRKKTRNSPPSGVIKKQNLGVGSVMVGQDGKTMYKVVEITMRGKPVKKWAKMKFNMGQLFCSKDDAYQDCPLVKGVQSSQLQTIKTLSNNIKRLFIGAQRDRNEIQKLTNQDTFLSLKGEKPENEEEIAGLKESMIGKSNTALRVKRNLDDRVLEINTKGLFGVTRLQELAKQNKANVDETKRRIEILQKKAKNDQENFKQRLKRLKKRLSKGMTRELKAKWEQYEEEERKKEKRKSRR